MNFKICLILFLGILSAFTKAAAPCTTHLVYAAQLHRFSIKNFPYELAKIEDQKRSHLSKAEKLEILGPEELGDFEKIGNIYRYLANIKWNKRKDSQHYVDSFEKKAAIARDLVHEFQIQSEYFLSAEGKMPGGDIYFIGPVGNFIYLRAKTGTFYKGHFNGTFSQEALLRTPMTELEPDYDP